MGVYLNGTTAYTLFKGEAQSPYFVDKSQMLEELFPLVNKGNKHICITRPRRFGKTVMANMVASFFFFRVKLENCLISREESWQSESVMIK